MDEVSKQMCKTFYPLKSSLTKSAKHKPFFDKVIYRLAKPGGAGYGIHYKDLLSIVDYSCYVTCKLWAEISQLANLDTSCHREDR